ncbi:hypothetical protein D3C80_455120 [compost metagenome]
MNTDADFHVFGTNLEIMPTSLREGTRLQRHTYGISSHIGLACKDLTGIERQSFIASGTRHFEDEEIACHTTPPVLVIDRRRGDVVGGQNGFDPDALLFGHLGSHLEVHDVASIIAVNEEHALSLGGCKRALNNRIWWRR